MKKLIKSRILAIGIILIILGLVSSCGNFGTNSAALDSSTFFQSVASGEIVRWEDQALPIGVRIDSGVSTRYPNMQHIVDTAIFNWESSAGMELFTINPSSNSCVITLDTTGQSDASQPGRTETFFHPETGEIAQAIIFLNPNYDFARVDFPTVIAHELGHVLGFAHINDPNAIMNPVLINGMAKSPSPAEVQYLKMVYH